MEFESKTNEDIVNKLRNKGRNLTAKTLSTQEEMDIQLSKLPGSSKTTAPREDNKDQPKQMDQRRNEKRKTTTAEHHLSKSEGH